MMSFIGTLMAPCVCKYFRANPTYINDNYVYTVGSGEPAVLLVLMHDLLDDLVPFLPGGRHVVIPRVAARG